MQTEPLSRATFRLARVRWRRTRRSPGVSLIELLCVLTIISILASMLLPVVAKAYRKAKSVAEEIEGPEVAGLLLQSSRKYCTANPQFRFTNKHDFADKCALAPKCRDWLNMSRTEFVPFNHTDPNNKLVLSVRVGRRYATRYAFTKGQLSIEPESR